MFSSLLSLPRVHSDSCLQDICWVISSLHYLMLSIFATHEATNHLGNRIFLPLNPTIFRLGQFLTHFEVTKLLISEPCTASQRIRSDHENASAHIQTFTHNHKFCKEWAVSTSSGSSFLSHYFLKAVWSQFSQCWNISWRGLFTYSFTWVFKFQRRSWAIEKMKPLIHLISIIQHGTQPSSTRWQ